MFMCECLWPCLFRSHNRPNWHPWLACCLCARHGPRSALALPLICDCLSAAFSFFSSAYACSRASKHSQYFLTHWRVQSSPIRRSIRQLCAAHSHFRCMQCRSSRLAAACTCVARVFVWHVCVFSINARSANNNSWPKYCLIFYCFIPILIIYRSFHFGQVFNRELCHEDLNKILHFHAKCFFTRRVSVL